MEFLKLTLFFFFLTHSLIHAQKNPCPLHHCGTNPLPILFPFMLQGHDQNCSAGGHPDFVFTCSNGAPLLTLSHSGNFTIRFINYNMQEIQVYDTGGCLPGKLMSRNLSSSPFAAMFTNKFIFLGCPRDAVEAAGLPTVGWWRRRRQALQVVCLWLSLCGMMVEVSGRVSVES